MKSHFDYVIKVLRYQLEQNRQNNLDDPFAISHHTSVSDVGAMRLVFSDWSANNILALVKAGREYFMNTIKKKYYCDFCGIYFDKDDEVCLLITVTL